MINGLFHIHALRKPNPRFAHVIHGLSGQSMDIADLRFAQNIYVRHSVNARAFVIRRMVSILLN